MSCRRLPRPATKVLGVFAVLFSLLIIRAIGFGAFSRNIVGTQPFLLGMLSFQLFLIPVGISSVNRIAGLLVNSKRSVELLNEDASVWDRGFLNMSSTDYIELPDWTARCIVPGRRGARLPTLRQFSNDWGLACQPQRGANSSPTSASSSRSSLASRITWTLIAAFVGPSDSNSASKLASCWKSNSSHQTYTLSLTPSNSLHSRILRRSCV